MGMLTSEKILILSQELRRKRKITRTLGKLALSQHLIAKHLGVTNSTLQRYEMNGYQNMKLGDFIKMVELMESHGIGIDCDH